MREIVYQEAAEGVFEPAPTRAQKRKATLEAKLAQQKRAKRIDAIGSAIGIVAVGAVYATTFVLFVFADVIWPITRP